MKSMRDEFEEKSKTLSESKLDQLLDTPAFVSELATSEAADQHKASLFEFFNRRTRCF